MNAVCATCANYGNKGCRIMLSRPKELFCYADIDTQLKREKDILAYAILYNVEQATTSVRRQARANIKRLNEMKEAQDGQLNV